MKLAVGLHPFLLQPLALQKETVRKMFISGRVSRLVLAETDFTGGKHEVKK